MSHSHAPPPEGEALEAARKRLGISQNEAARRAGLSGTRWRQIASGIQSTGGVAVPVRANADTLVRMARAVGLTPEELEAADRADAATLLRGSPAEEARRLSAEIERLVSELRPEDRERVERIIRAEEEAEQRARVQRLETVLEMIRVASPKTD